MANECECPKVEVKIKKSGSFGSRMRGLILGGLLGAGIALLAAPRPGFETRNLIMDKSNELKDKAMNRAEETRNRARAVTEQGKSALSDQTKQLKSAVEGVKEGIKTYQNQSSGDNGSVIKSDTLTQQNQNITMGDTGYSVEQ